MLLPMSGSSKIVMLTHEFPPKKGGIAVYCEAMAKAAIDCGYAVAVWAPRYATQGAQGAPSLPFPVHTLNHRGTLNWPCRINTAQAIIKQRKTLSDAILYLPEPGPILTMMYLQLIMPLPGKHKVMTLHGSEILRFTQFSHRTFLFRKLLAQMDSIGVVSKYVGGLLITKFPEVKLKTKIVSGALRSDFLPQKPLPEKVSDKLCIITVGRIHPRKGQHAVIAALGQLPAALKEKIKYQIIGPVVKQSYYERLRNMAAQSQVTIDFIGEVANNVLHNYYAQADIFCMTSTQQRTSIEGFGLVYLEASACGLPIIAHDTGGVREAVRNGETGIIIKPGSTQHLTHALQQLIDDPTLRRQYGEAGRQRVRELSWRDNVQTLFGDIEKQTTTTLQHG